MPTSHALSLALQLANLEARHLHAEKLLPDHLILGLLKLVDVDLTDFLASLPAPAARATRAELKALAEVFNVALVETTTLRRKLRYRLNPRGPSPNPSEQSPPPSLAYTDAITRADAQRTWPTLALLTCGLDGCGNASLVQMRESGYDPANLRRLAAESQPKRDFTGDWTAFIRDVAKLLGDWKNLPEAAPPNLGALWRRLLANAILRISADGTLHARLGKKTILRAPAELRDEWPELFGGELAASMRQFSEQAKTCGQPVEVPVDEL